MTRRKKLNIECDCSIFGRNLPPHYCTSQAEYTRHLAVKQADTLDHHFGNSDAELVSSDDEVMQFEDEISSYYSSEPRDAVEGESRHSPIARGPLSTFMDLDEQLEDDEVDHDFVPGAELSSDSNSLYRFRQPKPHVEKSTVDEVSTDSQVGQRRRGYASSPLQSDNSSFVQDELTIDSASNSEDGGPTYDYANPELPFEESDLVSAALHDMRLNTAMSRDALDDTTHLFNRFSNTKVYNYRTIRKRIEKRTGIKEVLYDCCRDSCIAYSDMYKDYEWCPLCKQDRWKDKALPPEKRIPFATFSYIPVLHRLRLQYAESRRSQELTGYRLRAYKEAKEGRVSDYWSSKLHEKHKEQRLFNSETDLAFLFSTDGIKVFKSRRSFSSWPLILINLNLDPKVRFLRRNILFAGCIPGPKNPKDLNSFLYPLVEEFRYNRISAADEMDGTAHNLRPSRELQQGVPGVYNAALPKPNSFILRAHIVLVGADMIGREKLTQFSGNRSNSYCLYCKALAVHNGKSNYCPLKPPEDPPAGKGYPTYDARNLPLRTHEEVKKIASHVTRKGNDAAAKLHGIKGMTILSRLWSIRFPESFPPDQMHLWFENVVPDMFRHYRGKFSPRSPTVTHRETKARPRKAPKPRVAKGASCDTSDEQVDDCGQKFAEENVELQDEDEGRGGDDEGDESDYGDEEDEDEDEDDVDYEAEDESDKDRLPPKGRQNTTSSTRKKKSTRFMKTDDPWNIEQKDFETMGLDMSASHSTFPTAFGDAVRNFFEHIHELKAAEWKIFTTHIAPIYLKGLIPSKDYEEFINLVEAINITLGHSHSIKELDLLEEKLLSFYDYYEMRFYRRKYQRLFVMLPVFHQILHVVHCIRWCGPMWVYSQWCGERMCGILASSVRSRVSANRNIAITTTLVEQKNHLLYTNAFATGQDGSMYDHGQDKDGNVQLGKLLTRKSTQTEGQALPLVDMQAPQQVGKMSAVLRKYINRYLENDLKDVYYIAEPMPKLKKWTAAILDKGSFKVTSNSMRPNHATRSSSHVRYETSVADNLHSCFGMVDFFFSIKVSKRGERRRQTLLLAYIENFDVELDGKVVKLVGRRKKVIEAGCMRELIGLIRRGRDEYIVNKTGCFLGN